MKDSICQQLKIAALHDIHKSLPITLQFTGRFTRVKSGAAIGEATMIANRASIDVQRHLRALYAEDADWNAVIRDLSHGATGEQEQTSEFLQTFQSLPQQISLQNIAPKMSTVVYETTCEHWDPNGVKAVFSDDDLYTEEIGLSEQFKVAWFVTQETSAVPWGEVRDITNVTYNLYVLHWDDEQHLLFINSSNNASLHEELAKAVAGPSAQIVSGTRVYRALHGIRRMVPTNLGLLDVVSRTRRFMMFVGADVVEGLETSQTQTKSKTNLFGFGFEDGERTSVGVSLKGRIWSYLVAHTLLEWITWCQRVGRKLVDETISTDAVFRGFIKPQYVRERPPLIPLTIEWPLAFLAEQEDRIAVEIAGKAVPFFDAGLDILERRRDGPICFAVTTEHGRAEYETVFGESGTTYRALGTEVTITIGKQSAPLSVWFRQFAPKFHFEKDTFIEQDFLLRVERDVHPSTWIELNVWPWTGVNIRKESQGPGKAANSIQRRVIETLKQSSEPWDLIFDDDDAREMADVVAIRMAPETLCVHLFHCKFSGEDAAGHRVKDLYEVCGQAQKSIFWRERVGLDKMVPHLINRERARIQRGLSTRFEVGSFQTLNQIAQRREVLRPEFKVWVVQPGLARAGASREMVELLAATALYLRETFNIDFGVISSA